MIQMNGGRTSRKSFRDSRFYSVKVAIPDELPSPNQVWSHGAVSTLKLQCAFEDQNITAIEADILMGHCKVDAECKEILYKPVLPIMAHPPERISDLSMEQFIYLTLSSSRCHIKLDFKELDTVSKTIHYVEELIKEKDYFFDKTIFLNADILPGPGKRREKPTVDANSFIAACFENMEDEYSSTDEYEHEVLIRPPNKYAFSLGWSTDCRSRHGYTKQDVATMKALIVHKSILERSKGVVLAVNARVLHLNCKPFNSILREFPEIQLLAWTGTGEPPISQRKINHIIDHFSKAQILSQVGFDCQISKRLGFFHDSTVNIASIFWNCKDLCPVKWNVPTFNNQKLLKTHHE